MSSVPSFEFGWWLNTLKGGSYDHIGNRDAGRAFTASSGTGKWWQVPTQTIAAGTTVDLYNYTNDVLTNLTAFIAEILSPTTGELQLDLLADRPTSATNTAASGLAETWQALPFLLYGMPLLIHTHRILTNVNEAVHVGDPIGGAGAEIGRVYRIRAKNAGSAAIEVARYVRN